VYVRRAIFAVFIVFALIEPSFVSARQEGPPSAEAADPAQRRSRGVEVAPAPPLTPQQQKEMNKERYAKLKKDTDQLLKLATELKESVDKANQNTLSLEVIKKSEQIEKLAKSVRDKMKNY
jgi:hypothetical protein